MWRAIASNALTLLIVGLVAAAGILAWGKRQFTGPGPLTEAICLRVDRGASLSAVSRALEAQGAVSDARIFRIGADYSELGGGLRFGSYTQIRDLIDEEFESVLSGEKTGMEALNSLVQRGNALLREFEAANS